MINQQTAARNQQQRAYQDQLNRQQAQDALASQAQGQAQGRAAAGEQRTSEKFAYDLQRAKAGDIQKQKLLDAIMGGLGGAGSSSSSSSSSYGGGGFDGGGGFASQGYTPPPQVAMPDAGQVQAPDISAAQNASFGLAKAKAGSMGQAAMRGLQGQLAERGITGSGVGARGLVRNLSEATNPLAELNVAQEGERAAGLQHSQDLAQQARLAQYQGMIGQRGQDIGAGTSAANLAGQMQLGRMGLAQRAQESAQSQAQSNNDRRLQILAGLAQSY